MGEFQSGQAELESVRGMLAELEEQLQQAKSSSGRDSQVEAELMAARQEIKSIRLSTEVEQEQQSELRWRCQLDRLNQQLTQAEKQLEEERAEAKQTQETSAEEIVKWKAKAEQEQAAVVSLQAEV